MTNPSPTDEANQAFDHYIKRARMERKHLAAKDLKPEEILSVEERKRRTIFSAAVIGFVASLIFALLVYGVNYWLLPGVPLYLFPSTSLVNFIGTLVLGIVLSQLSAGSLKIQTRTIQIILAILIIIFLAYNTWIYQDIFGGIMTSLSSVLFILLPVTVLVLVITIPFNLLIHWSVRWQVDFHTRPLWHWRRVLLPFMLWLLVFGAVMLLVLSPAEQQAAKKLQTKIQASLFVKFQGKTPTGDLSMAPNWEYAIGNYLIFPIHNPIDGHVGPNGQFINSQPTAFVTFESGYWMYCTFTKTGDFFTCHSGWVPPEPREPNAVSG